MFKPISKTQKIVGISILVIIIIIIGITVYYWAQEQTEVNLNEILELAISDNNQINNEVKEEKSKKILVHITGEVKKTGIIELDEGARIADAIKAAGGETNQADLNEVNLAYELEDGQKIYIPNKKDNQKNEQKEYITSESGNNVIEQEKSNSTKGVSKKVNINTASQSELESLPGIGPSIAGKIIEHREQNGKFQKIEDLQNVKGIGDSKYAKIKEYVTVK